MALLLTAVIECFEDWDAATNNQKKVPATLIGVKKYSKFLQAVRHTWSTHKDNKSPTSSLIGQSKTQVLMSWWLSTRPSCMAWISNSVVARKAGMTLTADRDLRSNKSRLYLLSRYSSCTQCWWEVEQGRYHKALCFIQVVFVPCTPVHSDEAHNEMTASAKKANLVTISIFLFLGGGIGIREMIYPCQTHANVIHSKTANIPLCPRFESNEDGHIRSNTWQASKQARTSIRIDGKSWSFPWGEHDRFGTRECSVLRKQLKKALGSPPPRNVGPWAVLPSKLQDSWGTLR